MTVDAKLNLPKLNQEFADMTVADFMRELLLGNVPPMQCELVEIFCQAGCVVYWNRSLEHGQLPLVHLGQLHELLGKGIDVTV